MRADPVDRDDELFLLDRLERGNLHDVVRGAGDTIQLTVWPEDIIISPDPPPPGTGGPGTTQPTAAGAVLIVASLPDPTGPDPGAETVTLLNTSAATVNLAGWALSDDAGGRQALSDQIQAGATMQLRLGAAVQLGNQGDTIRLTDAQGRVVDQVAYQRNQARAGRSIVFGR